MGLQPFTTTAFLERSSSGSLRLPSSQNSPDRAMPKIAAKMARRSGSMLPATLPAPARLHHQHVHVTKLTLGEAAFAVAQIIVPQPDELLRVTERADAADVGEEILAPHAQRGRVMRADILEVIDL